MRPAGRGGVAGGFDLGIGRVRKREESNATSSVGIIYIPGIHVVKRVANSLVVVKGSSKARS